MAITRSQLATMLQPGINNFIGEGYTMAAQDMEFSKLFGSPVATKNATEENIMVAYLGPAQSMNEGGNFFLDEGAGEMWKHRITMNQFGLRFVVTKLAVDDNRYMNPVKALSSSLGQSFAERKNIEGMSVLNTCFTAVMGDGKTFAASDHPTKDSGVNSNLLTAGDFNEGTLEAMVAALDSLVGQRGGMKLNVELDQLFLPVKYRFIAERLAKSQLRPGTNNNDINIHKGLPYVKNGYVICKYLTAPNAWFGKTNVKNGFIHYNRQNIQTNTSVNPDNLNIQVTADERYAFGAWDPLCLMAVPNA